MLDEVKKLIEKGILDPKRVGIVEKRHTRRYDLIYPVVTDRLLPMFLRGRWRRGGDIRIDLNGATTRLHSSFIDHTDTFRLVGSKGPGHWRNSAMIVQPYGQGPDYEHDDMDMDFSVEYDKEHTFRVRRLPGVSWHMPGAGGTTAYLIADRSLYHGGPEEPAALARPVRPRQTQG